MEPRGLLHLVDGVQEVFREALDHRVVVVQGGGVQAEHVEKDPSLGAHAVEKCPHLNVRWCLAKYGGISVLLELRKPGRPRTGVVEVETSRLTYGAAHPRGQCLQPDYQKCPNLALEPPTTDTTIL